MYDTFSEIMAEKTLDYVEARKANIMMEDNIQHDGSCDEVHPDKSHEEWEEDQEEFVQNEQMNMASAVPTDDMRTQVAKLGKGSVGRKGQERSEIDPDDVKKMWEWWRCVHNQNTAREEAREAFCSCCYHQTPDGPPPIPMHDPRCSGFGEILAIDCDALLPDDISNQGGGIAHQAVATESVISKIQECYSSKMPVNINIDGEQLQINPTFARDIILLHDELNEENQIELRKLIESNNIESFAKVMKFTQERN